MPRRSTRTTSAAVQAREVYTKGEECLAFSGLELFRAKVVAVHEGANEKDGDNLYTIHYLGWNKNHDTKCGVEQVVKLTKDNLAYQKELARAAARAKDNKVQAKAKPAKKAAKPKKKAAAKVAATPTRKAAPKTSVTLPVITDLISEEEKERSTDRQFTQKLRKLFYQYDTDQSNTLDKDELRQMLRSMGKSARQHKVNALFDSLDENNDGSIDFAEFAKHFKERDTQADTGLYCSCNGPYDERFMLACDAGLDGCVEWFHGDCVGVANASEVQGTVWFCPACAAKYPRELARVSDVVTVDGHKYDRKMLTAARVAHNTNGEVTEEDAKTIAGSLLQDHRYTLLEKATMKYLRANFRFTQAADALLRHAIASNAAVKGAQTKAKRAAASSSSSAASEDVKMAEPAPSQKKRAAPAAQDAPQAKKAKTAQAPRRTTVLLAGQALGVMLDKKNPQNTAFARESSRLFSAQLRRVFRRFDEDGNGRISRDELAAMMRSMGRRPLKKRIDTVFSALDVNEDGDIDFDEFIKYFREKDTETDPTPYCSCAQPAQGRGMVQCEANLEGCHEWYHFACVGLEDQSVPLVWFCSSCTENFPEKVALLGETVLVDGKRLDKAMITTTREAIEDHGEINLEDAKALLEAVLEDESYSTLEKKTMHYIREKCKISAEADVWLRKAVRSFATKQGAIVRATRRAALKAQESKDEEKVASSSSSVDALAEARAKLNAGESMTKAEEELVRTHIVDWFATNQNGNVSKLTVAIRTIALEVILAIAGRDWKEATGDVLAGAAITAKTNEFQQKE